MSRVKGFIVYRIYYNDCIVYVGRTKQPLRDRLRGHFFQKPMHRSIDIRYVTKIEYALLPTEADMNLYEIYYILELHPPMNVDDKTRDYPTVKLPELKWEEWKEPLFDKWLEIAKRKRETSEYYSIRLREITEEKRIIRSKWNIGEISDSEYLNTLSDLQEEERKILEKRSEEDEDVFPLF